MKKLIMILVLAIFVNISFAQQNTKEITLGQQTITVPTDVKTPEQIKKEADAIASYVINPMLALDSIAKLDSLFQKEKKVTDSLRAVITASKPTKESTPIDWFNWIIGIIVFVVLFVASRIKLLSKIDNKLVQIFASETFRYLQKVQYYCFGINVAAVSILYIGLLPDAWEAVINTIAIASFTIATGILFTTKKPELQG